MQKCIKNVIKNKFGDELSYSINNNSFMTQDVKSFTYDKESDIYSIDHIFVKPKNRLKGHASDMIKDLISNIIPENSIILTASGASMIEYKKEPTDDEYTKILSDLHKFYIKNNFASINNYVGYEHYEAFIYIGNNIGITIYNRIMDYVNN